MIPHWWKKKVTSAGKNFHIWVHAFRREFGCSWFPRLCNGYVCLRWCVFLYVCICVCTLRVSQSHVYLSFSRSTTCRVDLFVWREMGKIVCLDAVYHSLTSFYFPFSLYILADNLLQQKPWLIFWKHCALCQTVASFVSAHTAHGPLKFAFPCHLSDTYHIS